MSDVVRMILPRIALEKAPLFEVRLPNSLTAETLCKSARGEDFHAAKDAEDLFRQLGYLNANADLFRSSVNC